MSDSRDEPSLDAIRNTDDFIDALATGRPVTPQGAADAELAALLGGALRCDGAAGGQRVNEIVAVADGVE